MLRQRVLLSLNQICIHFSLESSCSCIMAWLETLRTFVALFFPLLSQLPLILLLHGDSAMCFAMFVNELLCAEEEELFAESKDNSKGIGSMGECELSFKESSKHNNTTATQRVSKLLCIPLSANQLRKLLMNVILKLEAVAEENSLQSTSMLNFLLTDGVNTVCTRYLRDPNNEANGARYSLFCRRVKLLMR
eukprot:m.238881 g.238881  ORF g.238881 m.238881 type:complete len:192 (-) comp13930_c0_seq56:3826-4401(-)